MDFEDAGAVFMETVFDIPDACRDYGEPRIRTGGYLNGRMVMVVWTPRGEDRHVFSMRKTNEREQTRYRKPLGES